MNIQPGHDRHCVQFHPSVLINYSFLDLEGGKFFFNTVKEGDSVLFATEDEQVRTTIQTNDKSLFCFWLRQELKKSHCQFVKLKMLFCQDSFSFLSNSLSSSLILYQTDKLLFSPHSSLKALSSYPSSSKCTQPHTWSLKYFVLF